MRRVPARLGHGATILVTADEQTPRHSEASMIRLPTGQLLLAWSFFTASAAPPGTASLASHAREWAHSRDNNPADIRAVRSDDEGRTWSRPEILVADDAGINTMQPALLPLGDGRVAMTYSVRDAPDRARRVLSTSSDGGRVWSAASDVSGLAGYVTASHDRLIRSPSGRLLQPCNRLLDGQASTVVAHSDDDGATWAVSDQIGSRDRVPGALAGFWEASIAPLPGGDLVMMGRSAAGAIYASRSADDGRSWTEPSATTITAPSAPNLVRRLDDGRLVLVHNTAWVAGDLMQGPRTPLVVSVSEDGRRWRRALTLEDDPGLWFHYPSLLVGGSVLALTYSITDPVTRLWSLGIRTVPVAELDSK